jgi:hypothetical protein
VTPRCRLRCARIGHESWAQRDLAKTLPRGALERGQQSLNAEYTVGAQGILGTGLAQAYKRLFQFWQSRDIVEFGQQAGRVEPHALRLILQLRPPRQHSGPALHQLRPGRPRRYRPHQSPVRRPRGRRHREQLPQAFPDPRNRRPVPRSHHPPAQAQRPRRRGPARRLALRRRRQDPPQGTPDGGVQPPHHRPPAQQRLQALRLDRHQPAVLRERRADQGNLVLRAPCPRGPESLLDDQADPRRAPEAVRPMVGRRQTQGPQGDRGRLESHRR